MLQDKVNYQRNLHLFKLPVNRAMMKFFSARLGKKNGWNLPTSRTMESAEMGCPAVMRITDFSGLTPLSFFLEADFLNCLYSLWVPMFPVLY
jgi:hypothetical protein